MLKKRLLLLTNYINENGIVTVNQLVEKFSVSDMTIRRDLETLDEMKKIVRVHGGGQSLNFDNHHELNHSQKKLLYKFEKEEVAKRAVSLIEENETIFLGTGTTIELFSQFFFQHNLKIVTNSLPVFESLQNINKHYEIILIGGNYRAKTGSFLGSLAIMCLEKMNFTKSFIGVNGIDDQYIYNSNSEEGAIQQIILNKSKEKIVVADKHKFSKNDFFCFYELNKIDKLITNSSLEQDKYEMYSQYTNIIINDRKLK